MQTWAVSTSVTRGPSDLHCWSCWSGREGSFLAGFLLFMWKENERNASCLDHIVSYDIIRIICIIVSFVKYGQPMPNANLRCHVWSLCHVSQVAGTLLRFLVEGQPRLQTSYLMMLFWQNTAKLSLVLQEMILSCVP